MKKFVTFVALLAISALLVSSLTSALIVKSINTQNLVPGGTGIIEIELENDLDEDIFDVSLQILFTGTSFTPIGSSEESIDKIKEDKDETFSFRIQTSNQLKPGNYEIPYIIKYNSNSTQKQKTGTMGIRVTGNPELVYSATLDNPILNQKSKLLLKITNKGFYDARFLSVKIIPEDFTLLSEQEVYVGTIDSDDFETSTFEVILSKKEPMLSAIIKYKDFDNQDIIKQISLPLTVYTPKEAKELGLIKQSYIFVYILIAVILIIAWLIRRAIKKKNRLKRSLQQQRE